MNVVLAKTDKVVLVIPLLWNAHRTLLSQKLFVHAIVRY